MEMLPKFLSMIVSVICHANQGAKVSATGFNADGIFASDILPM